MPKKLYGFAHVHNPDYYSNPEVAADIQRLTDLLEVIYESATAKRAAIEVNSKLTTEGKSEAREELKLELKKKRQGWLATLKPLDDQISQLEKGMVLSPHRPDDVVAALREMEVRSAVRKWDPVDIEAGYKKAAQLGDDLFVLAIENSPVPFKLKDDLVEATKLARLERKFPADAAKLADLVLGRKNLHSALRSVESNFRALGLEIAPDPVSDRAGLKVA